MVNGAFTLFLRLKDSFCIVITGTFYVMHARLIERSRNECVGKFNMKFIQNMKLVVKELSRVASILGMD